MNWIKKTPKWITNFVLFIIALAMYIVLFLPLWLLSTLICIIKALRKLEVEPLANYNLENAISIDEAGNVNGGPTWNAIFFWPWAKPVLLFGSRKQTMSMVFGVNLEGLSFMQVIAFYTPIALLVIAVVEMLDWGHMQKAADNYKKSI